MNVGRHALHSDADLRDVARSMGTSSEFAYWLLPRPFDLHLILENAARGPTARVRVAEPARANRAGTLAAWPVRSRLAVVRHGRFHPGRMRFLDGRLLTPLPR